jgi:hypothetical protein
VESHREMQARELLNTAVNLAVDCGRKR